MYTEQTSDGVIISLKVKCPITKKSFAVKYSSSNFEQSSGECDLCGSHGEVAFEYKCKYCETTHKKPRPIYHKVYIHNY